ncbi:small ubiquitin-related modifier 1-like [Tripterygium wilfordii]|uniref:small ubiquitin-related modifier 1-like n=1 Tax=Tripterygium wilfordii TaxID=458696 RepID=UPI0018F82521|nr:small ubiquitin-related modifier 1-like [Tripterygium wilfordii]
MSGFRSEGRYKRKRPLSPSAHINLTVKAQDGEEVIYRIKRNTPLLKLMTTFCYKKYLDIDSTVFLCDGRVIKGKQTSEELNLKDGDELDAMRHQEGGARA